MVRGGFQAGVRVSGIGIRSAAQDSVLRPHEKAKNPHPQYALASTTTDLLPRVEALETGLADEILRATAAENAEAARAAAAEAALAAQVALKLWAPPVAVVDELDGALVFDIVAGEASQVIDEGKLP